MIKTDVIIIGAGPVGLFAVHQLGIKGLKAVVIDNLDKAGGQCIELYPDKPIYDIPAIPECTGEELTDKLLEQIKPFKTDFYFNERVNEVTQDKEHWVIQTSKSNKFIAPNIIIAGGVGSFEPRKLLLKEAEKFEGKSLFYSVKNKEKFKGKNISIFGGGDSALDWTVELSKIAKSVSLVHRRDAFRGAQHTEEQMRELVAAGKVKLLTPYLIDSIEGSDKVTGVSLKNFDTNEIEHYEADELLFLFGLNKKLGPILEWNIDLNGKKISVNTENFQTSVEGIFAVGDINDYPGKLDLILSGFHETTLAVQEAYKRLYPGERVPFGYTTSNSKLQEKLGVKK